MKVGFVVTTHHSDICPSGYDSIINYIDSLIEFRKDNYHLYVIDNTSTKRLTHPNMGEDWFNYYYIEDQTKTGLTGAWNYGINKALENGCDIILNTNNDIILNDSVIDLINIIENHPDKDISLFGPVTTRDGLSTDHQSRNKKGDKIIETTNVYALNGYFNAFTKTYYNNFELNGNLYSTKPEHKWDGQEVELFNRGRNNGMKSFIVEQCFVKHIKYRAWSLAKNKIN